MIVEKHSVTSRESWLELRRQAVGASEIGALFGCHPYRTALEVYADKTLDTRKRTSNQETLTSGQLLEPVVAERVRQERPDWTVTPATDWLFARNIGMSCTPDFFVSCSERGQGVLQAKTVDPWAFKSEWTEDVPPKWIILQTLQEMFLAEVSWGVIAAMEVSRELPLHIYEFEVNEAAQQRLVKAVQKFWTDVAAGREPPADYTRDGDIIKAMYAEDNGEMIDLSGNNRLPLLLAEHERLSGEIKAIRGNEKTLKAVEAEIKAILGGALGATLPGWQVRSPTIARKGYVVEPTTYRTLKIERTAQMEAAA